MGPKENVGSGFKYGHCCYLSIYLSIYPSIYLSINQSINQSMNQSIYLSAKTSGSNSSQVHPFSIFRWITTTTLQLSLAKMLAVDPIPWNHVKCVTKLRLVTVFSKKTACTTFNQNNLVVKSDSEISNLLRFVERAPGILGGMNVEVPPREYLLTSSQILPHRIHGTSILTYMKGWFYGKCTVGF